VLTIWIEQVIDWLRRISFIGNWS